MKAKNIPKSELKDGAYYRGYCRNANISVWSEKHQAFFHWRYKFGNKFVEKINCPEDEEVYDVFLAHEEYFPTEEETIHLPES